jgi:hypothetical protein
MIQELKEIYLKNLGTLHTEISQYNKEEDLWITEGAILNCAGNLALHLVGNLNHFIGSVLGETGYVRNRDKEFSDKQIPRSDLLQMIVEVTAVVARTLSGMTDSDGLKIFPLETFGTGRSNQFVLMYLLAHFNYHLGQINYHRRILAT